MISVDPQGGYGRAKLIGGFRIGLLSECKSSTVRIFNAYGEFNKYDWMAQAIPVLIRKTIEYPEEGFNVWRGRNQTRKFVYVRDCIDSLLGMEG